MSPESIEFRIARLEKFAAVLPPNKNEVLINLVIPLTEWLIELANHQDSIIEFFSRHIDGLTDEDRKNLSATIAKNQTKIERTECALAQAKEQLGITTKQNPPESAGIG